MTSGLINCGGRQMPLNVSVPTHARVKQLRARARTAWPRDWMAAVSNKAMWHWTIQESVPR